MEIDQLEIPHAFCMEHSVPVAEKVAEYVDAIVQLDGRGGVSVGGKSKEEDEWSLSAKRLSSATAGSGARTSWILR